MKEKRIKENKRINETGIIYFILIASLFSCSFTRKKMAVEDIIPIFEVHFQNNFQGDSVSLRINGCVIFEKEKLESDCVLGVTKALVFGYNDGNKCQIKCFNKSISCNCVDNSLDIFVVLNNKEIVLSVDLRKGKYIGLSKKGISDLYLRQSIILFEYD